MKTTAVYILVLIVSALQTRAQDTILDFYIEQGLESNLALKQKQLSYEKNIAALREARGLFFPNISFNARYTFANGGRTIDFPAGDLLNPVYSTLNSLTSGYPPDQQFPYIQVENEEFQFYRPQEHETKLSLYQPIFSPKIYYNYKMKKDFAQAGNLDVTIYKRELVAEIKKAYYKYLQTYYVLELLDQTLELVEENVRVNESLFRNDKVTIDVVDRSKAEYSKVEQQIANAEKDNMVAAAYFNFLLNRPLDSQIQVLVNPRIEPEDVNMDEVMSNALMNREEFELIETYAGASEKYLRLTKMNKVPTLIGAVDYGLQGSKYEINDKADFFLGSLVLKWDLFAGMSNNAKIQQARLEKEIYEEKKEELEKQVNLEVIKAYYDLLAAEKSIKSARDQRKSTSSAFKLINKKYNQGQATLIEFLDARNSMTNAEENLIITLADYLVKFAELERVSGKYTLN